MRKLANLTYKAARTVVVTLVGGTVVLIGVVMLVSPGPAFVVIPIGLAILGLEWAWARRLLRTVKEKGAEVFEKAGIADRFRRWRGGNSSSSPAGPRPDGPK